MSDHAKRRSRTAPAENGSAQAPHVVVIGAGFAGLETAKELAGERVRVTLIDRNNYHKFQPLLYQVATAGLEPDNVAHNVRDIFRGVPNVDFRLGTVSGIDVEAQQVTTRNGLEIDYDYLVVAAGAVTNFFGVDGAREHSFPLKNLTDAIALRNRILRQFERVARRRERPASNDEAADGALRFVVVGGGPTGVETAGALTELFRVMQRDYNHFDTAAAEVVLVEMSDHLLSSYDHSQGAYTREVLQRRGVEVLTGATVERVEDGAVFLDGGRRLATETLVWAAGVAASPVASLLGPDGEDRESRRLPVGPDLRVPGGKGRVFAVGDASAGKDQDGRLYAQLAPVAMQQGAHAARQILRLEAGKSLQRFSYDDLGKMATIGRNAAVAELPGGLRLNGFVAWLAWVFIHIAKLVGFRNRLNAFTGWIYNYLTYDRSARLILDVVPISERIPREVEDVDADLRETLRAMEEA